ncbi:hypothetical protein EI94DRAFT_1917306 [Lactarius quietus]|nr:hypothetical protein EI94DRAFT_1917306 [Lactarius quietus]
MSLIVPPVRVSSVHRFSRGTDSEKGHLGVLSALVEFNCETDFVARNAFFSRLVADIALTAEFCVGPAKPETYSDSGGGSSIRYGSQDQLLNGLLESAENCDCRRVVARDCRQRDTRGDR